MLHYYLSFIIIVITITIITIIFLLVYYCYYYSHECWFIKCNHLRFAGWFVKSACQAYRASHGLSEVPYPAGPEHGDPYEAYGYDGEDGDDVLTLASGLTGLAWLDIVKMMASSKLTMDINEMHGCMSNDNCI